MGGMVETVVEVQFYGNFRWYLGFIVMVETW